jgi:hypothetical protein
MGSDRIAVHYLELQLGSEITYNLDRNTIFEISNSYQILKHNATSKIGNFINF